MKEGKIDSLQAFQKYVTVVFDEVKAKEGTVDSGYQTHALVGTIAKIYALHNEVRHIARVKG